MQYYIAEACGNSFVLFDCLSHKHVNRDIAQKIHACLLRENKDDALILHDAEIKDNSLYVSYLVLGVDGEIAEYCGNGTRVCSAYLHQHYPQYENYFIKKNGNNYQLKQLLDGVFSVELAKASFELNKNFIRNPDAFKKQDGFYYLMHEQKQFYFVDLLEPHLVLFESICDSELIRLGNKINCDEQFPLGMNVTRCHVIADNVLNVTAFERGVKRLTLSCGTGSAAAAALYLKTLCGKVIVTTPGGELEINCKENFIELKGPASIDAMPKRLDT